jgi:hypothetical protein
MFARLFATGTALAFALAAPANAAITIYNSAGHVQPPENVLLNNDSTGTTVFGLTNNTDTSVSFLSLANGVTLIAPAGGQARVEAVGSALDTLRFFLTNGQRFGEVEFDLHKATGATGNVTVTFFGSFGTEVRTFDLGNGNNWIAAETSGGDLITAISFDTNGPGVDDIRQVRLGGITAVGTAVPEPATWAMLLGGFGVVGASMRRRSRAAMLS